MNFEEEISYRNKILSKAHNGDNVTAGDRLWLATHRIYNRKLGFPYLNTDIIELQPNVKYNICVKVESVAYLGRILPVITVPAGKGRIVVNNLLANKRDGVKQGNSVKMLGVLVDLHKREAEFTYQSKLGLMAVSFECEYFDDKQRLIIRKNSNVGDPNYAMIGEKLAENKVLYRCKAPVEEEFQSFVFSIEWNAIS